MVEDPNATTCHFVCAKLGMDVSVVETGRRLARHKRHWGHRSLLLILGRVGVSFTQEG